MNKSFVMFTLIAALFVSAITTVLGESKLMSPFVIFPVLSLLVPIFMRRMTQFKEAFPFKVRYHVYSWLIATVFALFTTIMAFTIESTIMMVVAVFVAYFLMQVLISLVALLMTLFFGRSHRWGIIDEAIDMCIYILPVPFIYIGSILYMDLQNPVMLAYYARAIDVNIFMAELILLVVALLVFVIYMYPKDTTYKFPRLLRIIVTAGMWLAMNAHILYGGYIPEFIKTMMPSVLPMYQGNILVFFTPGSIEASFIIASVIIGKLVEVCIIKALKK